MGDSVKKYEEREEETFDVGLKHKQTSKSKRINVKAKDTEHLCNNITSTYPEYDIYYLMKQ